MNKKDQKIWTRSKQITTDKEVSYKPDKGIRNEEGKIIIKTLHAPNNIASKCTEQQLVTGGGKQKKGKINLR